MVVHFLGKPMDFHSSGPAILAGPRRWNRAVAMEKVAGPGALGRTSIQLGE